MTLAHGARLGSYEVIAKLGEGGMGEVYRARDTKLDRDVAIKVLPESFATDADRVARFTREAKTLAALNHPNIAQIYGIESPSAGSGQATAIVMELVEGRDLSEMIGGGAEAHALHLPDAIAIARQIADALEAAHEQGIIHRDLKPQNIKVRDDGTVKVLDFGLAKALDPSVAHSAPGTAHQSMATMTSPAMTAMGMILGTAAYMSPEQARGKAVDKRADIWAYGVVLYEMLTGRRAFEGAEVSDVLAAVLRQDVDFTALPSDTPAAVRRLLARCLDRDLKRRLRDIGEARIILEDPAAADSAAPAPVAPASPISRAMPWTLAAAMTVFSLALWAPRRSATVATEGVSARFQLTLPEGVTPSGVSNQGSMAISPDGRTIALVAGPTATSPLRQLWLRPLDADDARPLAGTEGASTPFWSPDGRSLAFFTADSLKRIDIATGTVTPICAACVSTALANRGGSWGADNVIRELTLWTIDMERGTSTRLTNEGMSRDPIWFPAGDRVAYVSVRDTPPNPFVRTLPGVETRLLRRMENWQTQDVSRDGRSLLMWNNNHLFLLSTSGDGTPEPFLQTPFNTISARIAPSGGHVALQSNESGATEVYVTTFPKAGRLVRVSTTGGTSPRWRGDGAELYFQSGRNVMAVSVTPDSLEPAGVRLGQPKVLFDLPPNIGVWLPSTDGQRFLVTVQVRDVVPAPTTVILNWATLVAKQ